MPVAKQKVLALAASATTASLLAVSCGDSGPSSSTPPATAPPSTVTASGSGAAAASCALGNGSAETSCERKSSKLARYVENAINQLVVEKPQAFDLNDVAVANTDLYKVKDPEAYLDGIVDNIRRQGACAERDADDFAYERILVKDTNEYSEVFDVLLSSNYIRRTSSGYLDTCSPASFPIDRAAVDAPPAGSGCGRPYPPPISRFRCKVHMKGFEFYTLDSTPLVGPDVRYCTAVGYTDGRSICDVRPEGAPDREACENWRVGKAKDTGRPGPTWTNELTGQFCTGPESNCTNSPGNQYQLLVYRSGKFRVAAENGANCIVDVER